MNRDFYLRKLQEGGAVLAPMAGFTDAPFRKLCREHGSAWAVTEMVSAKALVLGAQRGIEIGEPYPGEPDLVIQLFAADPDLAAAAARLLWERYRPSAFDLNMGCPVKKVVNKGCGSQLMRTPDRAHAIVRALREAVPIPVSAKMRLGVDRVNVREVARAVAEAGADLVAVHGRTAAQKYGGEADWDEIERVADELRPLGVPVLGSGDVDDRAAFERHRARGLGVMIARGALGRPWIFAEVRGEPAPGREEIARLAYRHAALNCAWYGEASGMRQMRGQLARYFAFAPELRARLVRVETLAELEEGVRRGLGLEPRCEVEPLRRAA